MEEKTTTATENSVENPIESGSDKKQDAADGKTQEPEKKFSQEEVNKIVSDRVSETNRKWQERMTESEKMSKMTEEQKAEHERRKKENEFAEREASITARELKMTAKEILSERGLPLSLAQALNYSDAEKCKASIDTIEKAFRDSVDKAVSEKIRNSSTTPRTGSNSNEAEKDAARRIMGLSPKSTK